MEVKNYSGVIAQLVTAISEAGDHPTSVRRIDVTPAEMKEIQNDGSFITTVSKYYGDSSTLILDNIRTDMDGNFLSFYLGGILVARRPTNPEFVEALTYPAGSVPAEAETSFVIESGGNSYMLSGVGNPVDDFTISKNANIELGLAIRKRNDLTNYNDGAGSYEIALKPDELWTFAVTVGSLNADVKNICDMYAVVLSLDVDPSGDELPHTWTLAYDAVRKNYVWANAMGIAVVKDAATNAEQTATQTIQRYDFDFIKPYLRNVVFNEVGSPMGLFGLTLKATPKWKLGLVVETEVLADITRYVEPA